LTREEIGLALDAERKLGTPPVDLWSRVTLGRYTLMKQGSTVLLVKDNTIVWSADKP
jgi:hypothetical protein